MHSRKNKQRNKCRKNNRFKKVKLKKRNKKENSTELQRPNIEAEDYNSSKKYDRKKKRKPKSLIRFHSANKTNNYNRAGGGGGGKGKKIRKNLQSKSRHKNNKCFS